MKIDRTNDASEDGCRKIDFFKIIGFNVISTVQVYVVISGDNEDWKYYTGYISFLTVRLEIVPRFSKKIAILRVRFFLYSLETKIRLVFLIILSYPLFYRGNSTRRKRVLELILNIVTAYTRLDASHIIQVSSNQHQKQLVSMQKSESRPS